MKKFISLLLNLVLIGTLVVAGYNSLTYVDELEKSYEELQQKVIQYENAISEMNDRNEVICSELTKMFNDEAFVINWNYDGDMYQYSDNGTLFGVSKFRSY